MPMNDKIKLVIDGVAVEVAKGTSVLEAAQGVGIYIPSLCYHPDLPLPSEVKADDFVYRQSGRIGIKRGGCPCSAQVVGSNLRQGNGMRSRSSKFIVN